MFDIGWSELLLIGGVALVVIGPKDLPRALRTLGQTTTKVRRMASDFQRQFSEAMREADMEEFRKGVSDVVDTARDLKSGFNPIDRLRDEIKGAIDKPNATNPLPSVEVPTTGDYLNSLPSPPATGDAGAGLMADAPPSPTAVKKAVRRKRADVVADAAVDMDLARAGLPARKPRSPRKPAALASDASDAVSPTGGDVQVAAVGDDIATVKPKRRAPRKKPQAEVVGEAPVVQPDVAPDYPSVAATAPVVDPLKRASDGTP